jgi:hypothetical protein
VELWIQGKHLVCIIVLVIYDNVKQGPILFIGSHRLLHRGQTDSRIAGTLFRY